LRNLFSEDGRNNSNNEEELEDIYIDDDDEAFWNEVFGY